MIGIRGIDFGRDLMSYACTPSRGAQGWTCSRGLRSRRKAKAAGPATILAAAAAAAAAEKKQVEAMYDIRCSETLLEACDE